MNTQVDIRHVLPTIRVPTLILHRTGDLDIDVGGSRYMARRIPGARFVELSGDDHLPWVGDQNAILKEVAGFVQGLDQVTGINRVLATVLYAELGYCPSDAADAYRVLLLAEIRRFRGQEIEIAPRRAFAIFDGPARAIRAACAIRDSARNVGLHPALGVNTGECEMSAGQVQGISSLAQDSDSKTVEFILFPALKASGIFCSWLLNYFFLEESTIPISFL
jgi:hypothetical protein